MATEDGGSAFPIAATEKRSGSVTVRSPGSKGLSKRDWFAGQALVGVMKERPEATADEIASSAYGIADAMLRHRAKAD